MALTAIKVSATFMEPMKTTIVINGRIPSKKNSTRRIQRGNRVFNVPSKAHEEWEKNELLNLRELYLSNPINLEPPYSITIEFYPPDRRKADLTNKAESIMDLLVKAGIIEDDNWHVLKQVALTNCGIQKAGKAVVIIEEIS